MYEIEPLNRKPDRVRVSKRLKYPLDELTVGMSFTVPADCADQFRNIRVAASDYSRKHSVKLRCNVQADGSLLVWRDKMPTDASLPQDRPSEFELISYLASMQNGQSFTLGLDYASRFEQLSDWIEKYAASAQIEFVIESLDSNGSMKVTKRG